MFNRCYTDHIGFIREDTSHKVYFRNHDNEEWLVYDFDVELNDTIEIYYSGLPAFAVVEGFGIFEGITPERRTILLSGLELPSLSEIWIEGIGSNRGLLESGFSLSMIVGAQYNLLCYQEDDTLIYLNPRFSFCSWPSSVGLDSDEARNNRMVNIYPNPVVAFSTFEIDYQSNLLVTLLNQNQFENSYFEELPNFGIFE